MNRWFWKRWIWAVVVGTTAAVGFTLAQQGGTDAPSGPPKVGDVITLKFRDMPDRQVKVLKSDKQSDGTYLSEVKDTKSGETFTLLDKPEANAPKPDSPAPKPGASKGTPKAFEAPKVPDAPKPIEPPKAPTSVKPTDPPPKAKPRTSDPLLPALKDTMPDLAKEKDLEKAKERERRFFSSGDKSSSNPDAEEEKPGMLKRIFGRKKATPPATPAASSNTAPSGNPAFPTSSTSAKPTSASPAMPPAVRPAPTASSEPPRTVGVRPVAPPTPIIPAPVSVPSGPAATIPPIPLQPVDVPAPTPLSLPAIPNVPPVPVPAPSGLPSIPIPPSGMSVNGPVAPLPPKKPEVASAMPVAPTLPAPVMTAAVEPQPKMTVKQPAGVMAKEPVKEVVTAQVKEPVKEVGTAPAKEVVTAQVKEPEKVLPSPAAQPVPLTVVTAARAIPAPVVPVVMVPAPAPQDLTITAMMRDIEPYMTALQNGVAPSQRALAARALSGCRHGSCDMVKLSLFRAAQNDGNPMVRAVCIEELVKLGYFEPAFTVFLTKASEDSSEEVRKAAKEALIQMTPRR